MASAAAAAAAAAFIAGVQQQQQQASNNSQQRHHASQHPALPDVTMMSQVNFARPWDMTNNGGQLIGPTSTAAGQQQQQSSSSSSPMAGSTVNQLDAMMRQRSSLGLAPLQAIRCTVPSCPCDCFLPGKHQLRHCQTCRHGWVPHALDKLGMRSGSSSLLNSPAGPVEPALPNTVFDVASLALYGCQALPIRLKILLDRLFSVLAPEDVVQVLTGFGWTLDDYARGYILQDGQGRPVDFWSICGRDEEPLVLQQFLRFGETRAIAARILQQHEAETQKSHQAAPSSGTVNNNNNNNTTTTTTSGIGNGPGLVAPKPHHHKENQQQQQVAPLVAPNPHDPFNKMNPEFKRLLEKAQHNPAVLAGMLPAGFNPLAGLPFPFLPGLAPQHLARLPAMMPVPPPQPPHHHQHQHPASAKTPPSGNAQHNNNNTSSSSTASSATASGAVPSPLNRLQGMQPFDARPKSPPKSEPAKTSGSPLCLANKDGQRSSAANSTSDSELEWDEDDLLDDEVYDDASSALNLTRKTGARPEISDSLEQHRRQHEQQHRQQHGKGEQRSAPGRSRGWNPLGPLGTQLINPQTGKKRVQCNVCLKTFCDKGALKIHFSAVHLREMHKCTVDGCNMMFSSRRSRNRHSANPNPKLHSPHLRRKISPHDGRTAQPHPSLGTLISHVHQQQGVPFGLAGLPLVHPAAAAAGLLADRAAAAAAAAAAASASSVSSGGAEANAETDKRRGSLYAASSDELDDECDELSSSDDEPNSKLPVASGVRKRKSQNPTRLLVDDDKDSDGDGEGDDDADEDGEHGATKRQRDERHGPPDDAEKDAESEKMDDEKRLTPSPAEFLSRIYANAEGAMHGLASFMPSGQGLHPAAAAFFNAAAQAAAAAAHAAAVASANNGQVNGHAPPTSSSASPSPPVAVRSSV